MGHGRPTKNSVPFAFTAVERVLTFSFYLKQRQQLSEKMPFSFNGVAHIIMGREAAAIIATASAVASHTRLNTHTFYTEGIALPRPCD